MPMALGATAMVSAGPTGVSQYAMHYEILRAQIIGIGPWGTDTHWPPDGRSRRGIGLALLLRAGMPAWIDAMTPVISTITLPPAHQMHEGPAPSPSAMPSSMAWLPAARLAEATTLLASVVLSTCRGVRPTPITTCSLEGTVPC
jgi:hypothetical protein